MSGSKNTRSRADAPTLIHITSLGCAKNFVDTELAAASLLMSGFGIANDERDAKIRFVNTCAFIESARAETASVLRDAVKWKAGRKGRLLVVGGCVVEWDKDGSWRAQFPEVDLWTRIDSIASLGRILAGLQDGASAVASKLPKEPRFLYDHTTPRLQLTPGHFAYLKIADGCDNRCSYCSIPLIRGPLRSRSSASVLKEAQALLLGGCKELVVIAQDSGAFGNDRAEASATENLPSLLKRLDALDSDSDFWLRLMYVHPRRVSEAFLEALATSKRHLVPCLEMPLQHIADGVLKAMGRKIGGEAARLAVERVRGAVPGIGLRTTFLVGFPGETDADFEELLAYVKSARFERLGAFAYSPEPGTPAAKMSGRVSPELAEERRAELMRVQAAISLERNLALAGSSLDVIVDNAPSRGIALGRGYMDAPEIDNSVELKGASGLKPGDFVKVLIKGGSEYGLSGLVAKG